MSTPAVAAGWQPTALATLQATTVALADVLPRQVDALFIHGSPIRDDNRDRVIINHATGLYHVGQVKRIILNGLTRQVCEERNLAYHGFESWESMLLEGAVPSRHIILMAPAAHTGAESRNLLIMAEENGWNTLAISSQAHHQLRCFLQIIALMEEVDFHPAVYNAPAPGIAWDYPLSKPVMAGGTAMTEDVQGLLPDHIQAEMERIIMYAQRQPADHPPRYTRNATFEEMFAYLNRRAKM